MRRTLTGLRAWLVQRVTAVYMLLFIVFLLTHFVFDPPGSYLAWRDWILNPGVSISISVFFAALLMHAWVGVRDVILDYIHPIGIRIFALALLAIGLISAGFWVIRVLYIEHG